MPAKFSLTKKDFSYQWFSGTGAGGQHRNKHQNCFRIKHPASGATATGQSHRDRKSNQREAMNTLKNDYRFKFWCAQRLAEIEDGETLEQKVDKSMAPNNLRVEVKNEKGEWVEEGEKTLDFQTNL